MSRPGLTGYGRRVDTQPYRRGAGLDRLRAALNLPPPVTDPALVAEFQRRSDAADAHAERVYGHADTRASEPIHYDPDEDVA